MRRHSWRDGVILAVIGALIVIWFALLAAPYWELGLIGMVTGLQEALKEPFRITLCGASGRTVLICLFFYGLALLYLYASHLNTRYGEEHGSAKWGDAARISAKLRDRAFTQNRLCTQNVRIDYDFYRHKRNLNTLVVGGSGASKTRGYVMPNIMQGCCSMIILDPKGENLMGTGKLLEEEGIVVKVLDLIEMEKSWHYNPFLYLRNENDVQTMVTFLFAATTPKEARSQDPFWDKAAEMLLMALVFYLWLEAPPEEQNFAMVMELLRCAAITDEDKDSPSITDILFRRLEKEKPGHIALRYYRSYRSGAGKTLKSIQLVLASHLDKFNLSSLAELTSTDDLDLRSLGERKTALFCKISDTDKSYNFLVSMLYIQVIQQLFECADLKYHGKLPVHVHFLMDEFANVAVPDEFESYLSTMRPRNISASIILQNIAQLKALFKDNKWESIIGNCDEFLYLGGNEQSTHKYVSEQLGKETIWTRSTNLTRGRQGHAGRNDQTAGRELMTPDEVRMMDNGYCVLLIRGFRPIYDRKYNLMTHPRIKRTMMGGGEPYFHMRPKNRAEAIAPEEVNTSAQVIYEILTEAELEAALKENKLSPVFQGQ